MTMLNSQAAQKQVAARCGHGLPIPILVIMGQPGIRHAGSAGVKEKEKKDQKLLYKHEVLTASFKNL